MRGGSKSFVNRLKKHKIFCKLSQKFSNEIYSLEMSLRTHSLNFSKMAKINAPFIAVSSVLMLQQILNEEKEK